MWRLIVGITRITKDDVFVFMAGLCFTLILIAISATFILITCR